MTNDEIWQLFRDNSYKDNYRDYVGLEKAVMLGRRIRDKILEINAKLSVENAEKDAKIYAYEAIIANSNFKAILPKKGQNE